jgi:hypothetical protein
MPMSFERLWCKPLVIMLNFYYNKALLGTYKGGRRRRRNRENGEGEDHNSSLVQLLNAKSPNTKG